MRASYKEPGLRACWEGYANYPGCFLRNDRGPALLARFLRALMILAHSPVRGLGESHLGLGLRNYNKQSTSKQELVVRCYSADCEIDRILGVYSTSRTSEDSLRPPARTSYEPLL